MRVITIKRNVSKEKRARTIRGRFVLEFARDFFARENHLEFALEALLFGTLLALSAWPIIVAAGAIDRLL
ncbi:MAG: hypothetical protein DME98_02225 [Verrucomicrobia bacterium]|nr:MAG: hypothetical protein DME98_02225 [Verrucomicrobiota bacterium]PYJ35687.1 MAG: hypothetical protein DME88_01365 [Verrucomicrobiota bacterium]